MVDTIIVNYGTYDLTVKAVASVIDDPLTNVVIVVDSASPDGSGSKLAQLYKDNEKVRVLELQENVGFGRSNNEGAKQSNAEYLFFLNSDATAHHNCLTQLVNALDINPAVGIVAPKVLCPDGSEQLDAQGVFPTVKRLLLQQSKQTDLSDEPEWISGVAFMARRDEFVQLGGFDPDFFMYFEDIDLSWRFRQSGKILKKERNAEVTHLGGASRTSTKKQKFGYYQSQDLYLSKRNVPYWQRQVLAIIRYAVTKLWVPALRSK